MLNRVELACRIGSEVRGAFDAEIDTLAPCQFKNLRTVTTYRDGVEHLTFDCVANRMYYQRTAADQSQVLVGDTF